jgi:hypothetical protein
MMGGNSGSREPNPQAVSALSGFDPGRESAFAQALRISTEAGLVEDVTEVCQRAKYICRVHPRYFGRGIASELADAVDRLAVKVAELRELEDAGR